MAPAGSFESLAAAFAAGADSVYFGAGALNMRSRSAGGFTLADLREAAALCRERGVKSYLTVNAVIYDGDMEQMRSIVDAACEADVSAVIASDMAVILYCRQKGMEVHLSTQLNISNFEALKFYSQFADVAVMARELSLEQVSAIHRRIQEQDIRGPKGGQVRIEMFCHGALCMAVSGKCYLSLNNLNSSANRGECLQMCRRSYTVRERETGAELDIDNEYILSPKDLKTIRFLDLMVDAGVKVFKIEGRARGPEYVLTVTECYREALRAVLDGTFTEARKDEWDARLATVFNRGFWDGYYLGRRLGEWNETYGSRATERKVYAGRGVKYYSRLGVGEFLIEAAEIHKGDKLLVTGPTTGAVYFTASEIHGDSGETAAACKGERVSIPVDAKIRPSDKLFKIVKAEDIAERGGAALERERMR